MQLLKESIYSNIEKVNEIHPYDKTINIEKQW